MNEQMEIQSDEFSSIENRSDSFPNWIQKIQDFLRRLMGFFVLSDEELSESGIRMDSENREGLS
jgi:hypothetical protein